MKFNFFIASVLVSQSLGFRMLRRANDWKERGLSGIERLNQIRLQREGESYGQMALRNTMLSNVFEQSVISYSVRFFYLVCIRKKVILSSPKL